LQQPGINPFDFETFNTLNHAQFTPSNYQAYSGIGGTVSDVNDPRLGCVISASAGRVVQLAGKLYFERTLSVGVVQELGQLNVITDDRSGRIRNIEIAPSQNHLHQMANRRFSDATPLQNPR